MADRRRTVAPTARKDLRMEEILKGCTYRHCRFAGLSFLTEIRTEISSLGAASLAHE